MKLIQISSGKGPLECELAVGKYLKVFIKKHKSAKIIESYPSPFIDCFKSVLLEVNDEEKVELGPIKWICQSPFRQNHKRKNWFIEVSEISKNGKQIDVDQIHLNNKSHIRFETFLSGGKGGQNVNKLETGVRVIHLETGITATSTTARTQLQNKKMALNRLIQILVEQNNANTLLFKEQQWLEQERITRGNAIATFEGMEFKLQK